MLMLRWSTWVPNQRLMMLTKHCFGRSMVEVVATLEASPNSTSRLFPEHPRAPLCLTSLFDWENLNPAIFKAILDWYDNFAGKRLTTGTVLENFPFLTKLLDRCRCSCTLHTAYFDKDGHKAAIAATMRWDWIGSIFHLGRVHSKSTFCWPWCGLYHQQRQTQENALPGFKRKSWGNYQIQQWPTCPFYNSTQTMNPSRFT